jgi:hypothetical protein
MKIAQRANAIEVICFASGNRSLHIALNSSTINGYRAYNTYRKCSNFELGAALSAAIPDHLNGGKFVQVEAESLLLELIRRTNVLKRQMFHSRHTYCIVCTCIEVITGTYHFHLAGLMDTSLITEHRPTERHDIPGYAIQLIGGNIAYYDCLYDNDAFVQQLKAEVGGPQTCDCGQCDGTFFQVTIAPECNA